MLLLVLIVVSVLTLHVSGPFPTFFEFNIADRLSERMMLACVVHGVLEEYIFRHLFWTLLPEHVRVHMRATMVYLNVLLFWLFHVLILYAERSRGSGNKAYENITYHLSCVFMGMMLNAIYLESGGFTLANCMLLHICILIVWSAFLGGDTDKYYQKYNIHTDAAKIGLMFKNFIQRGIKN